MQTNPKTACKKKTRVRVPLLASDRGHVEAVVHHGPQITSLDKCRIKVYEKHQFTRCLGLGSGVPTPSVGGHHVEAVVHHGAYYI